MAWNDGGNGKNNDPWGSGGDQGPPDLDEAFRKFEQTLFLNPRFGHLDWLCGDRYLSS